MNIRDAITQFIFISQPPKRVDWAVVLTCPSITNIDPAISLYRAGLTANILITGHGPTEFCEPEWRVYQQYALQHGVAASAMLIEPEARNTQENFVLSNNILDREVGWSNISTMALITKPVHSRRALMTARKYFPKHVELTVISPSDEHSIQPLTWWQTPHGRERVFGELRKIGEYGLKGHLADS